MLDINCCKVGIRNGMPPWFYYSQARPGPRNGLDTLWTIFLKIPVLPVSWFINLTHVWSPHGQSNYLMNKAQYIGSMCCWYKLDMLSLCLDLTRFSCPLLRQVLVSESQGRGALLKFIFQSKRRLTSKVEFKSPTTKFPSHVKNLTAVMEQLISGCIETTKGNPVKTPPSISKS